MAGTGLADAQTLAATPTRTRTRIFPRRGTLIVSTDMHGNAEDFAALRDRFLAARDREAETYWAILGDAVHGPSPEARERRPDLYDYDDQSAAIVRGVLELQAAHGEHVAYVLGNHDHGHVGGPHTAKFYPDEVVALERRCSEDERVGIKELFSNALLAAVAPCGVLMAHGCPDDRLVGFADLEEVRLCRADNDVYRRHLLDTFTRSYGQSEAVVERLLKSVTATAVAVNLIIHGHDRDEAGYFMASGARVLCPVLFGAPRREKRYVQLDLAATYESAAVLRDGCEIRRLYVDG
jgi:hypothetical protein